MHTQYILMPYDQMMNYNKERRILLNAHYVYTRIYIALI